MTTAALLLLLAVPAPRAAAQTDALNWVDDGRAVRPPAEEEAEFSAPKRWNPVPYLNLRLLGGQYFFAGSEGGLSGNANLVGGVSLELDDRSQLLATYSGSYRGTKSVADLVGGGTLFQERQNHRASLAVPVQLSEMWTLRPEAGMAVEFLKETKNENWGSGLFDYRRPFFSVDADYRYADPLKLNFGVDFYYIHFQNYTALESQAQTLQASGSLARELAGPHTLDSYNVAVRGGGEWRAPWSTVLESKLVLTRRVYPDQNVALSNGLLSAQTRRDTVVNLNGTLKIPRAPRKDLRLMGSLGADFALETSNQNSYDAQRTKFLPEYYDSMKFGAGAGINLYKEITPKKFADAGLDVRYRRTQFKERPVQDASGAYQSEIIHYNEFVLALSGGYPISPGFRWTFSLQMGKQSSNMGFEKLYRYNYDTVSYLMGFVYEL